MLTLPNIEDAPNFDAMAVRDSTDFYALASDAQGTGVVSGCGVTQDTGSDMKASIALGTFYVAGATYSIPAAALVTVGAASTSDRRDIAVASRSVTLNATHTNGGGAITSIAVLATAVAIPSGSTLVMPNGDSATTSALANAGATTISINSYTPSSTITSGQPVVPLWVVAGTPCGYTTGIWTKSVTTNNPPVKPLVPAGSVLLGEIYVSLSTTVITTAANIVDKTAIFGVAGQFLGTVNANAFGLINVSQVLVGESSTSLVGGGVEIATSGTYTAGGTYTPLNIIDTATFNTTNPSLGNGMLYVGSTWTVNKISNLASMAMINLQGTINGSAPFGNLYAFQGSPGYGGTANVTNLYGIFMNPYWGPSGAHTLGYMAAMSLSMSQNTGTVTTGVILDVGAKTVVAGSFGSLWGMQVGAYNSYFNGLTTFGGTAAPLYAVHLQGGNSGSNALALSGSTTTPTAPTVPLLTGGNVPISVHIGSGGTNTYLMVGPYDDAGTTRYFYVLLNTTGVTWTKGTTVPT